MQLQQIGSIPLTIALAMLTCGCGTSSPSPSLDETSSVDKVVAQEAKPSPMLAAIPGEWEGIDPVWDEAGKAGPGTFPDSIDVKQVYVNNDGDFVHVLLRVSPTVQERFSSSGSSGDLCDIFFDVDNDSSSGCKEVDGFDYGMINGYEFRLWIPLGVQSGGNEIQPFVSYELQTTDASGQFTFNAVAAAQSLESNALIQHGDYGVKLSIPLKALNVAPGANIRLLLKESADPFSKQSYSEGTYAVK